MQKRRSSGRIFAPPLDFSGVLDELGTSFNKGFECIVKEVMFEE